jgi:hypothetical protein
MSGSSARWGAVGGRCDAAPVARGWISTVWRSLTTPDDRASVAARAAAASEYERLAFEAAQRALDKQERLLEELRSRTGILLAAAALGASFLGREAFGGDPRRGLAVGALVALLIAIGSSVYILIPKADRFVFAVVGSGLYEGLYAIRNDLPEVYRRLAYDLDRFWEANDAEMQKLFSMFRLAAGGLVVELLLLVAMVGDTLY